MRNIEHSQNNKLIQDQAQLEAIVKEAKKDVEDALLLEKIKQLKQESDYKENHIKYTTSNANISNGNGSE